MRSAFTYGEIPSRLDLAKQRYGGPFTTWEVEDVKSFWRILLVLVSLVGFQLIDDTKYVHHMAGLLTPDDKLFGGTCMGPSVRTVTELVIFVYIPIHQLVVRPFFSPYIPKMLTRMKLGLMVELLSLIATTVFSGLVLSGGAVHNATVYLNITRDPCLELCIESGLNARSCYCSLLSRFSDDDNVTSAIEEGHPRADHILLLLIIPQALNGLAYILVFLTTLEFIFTQAPRAMRGFLIGLWYAMLSVNVGISAVSSNACIVYDWEYYAAKSLLTFLSIFLFAKVARNYKYRKLNEDVDVNVYQEIEDAFERNLDREAEYLQQRRFTPENMSASFLEIT